MICFIFFMSEFIKVLYQLVAICQIHPTLTNIKYDIQIKGSEHRKLRPQTFHILQCPIGDCIRPIYFQTIYHPAIMGSQHDWFVNQDLHFGKDYTTILHLLFPKTLILQRKAIPLHPLCYDNQY